MDSGRLDSLEWHRSSWCNGGHCLEAARRGDTILVRKSDDPGITLTVHVTAWREFLSGLRSGGLRSGTGPA